MPATPPVAPSSVRPRGLRRVACVVRRNAEKLEPLVQAIRDQGGEVWPVRRTPGAAGDRPFARTEGEVGAALEAVISTSAPTSGSHRNHRTGHYRKVWRWLPSAVFTGREVARVMLPRQRGTIIFTGATALLRGRAFRRVLRRRKFALRARPRVVRELGPKGASTSPTRSSTAPSTPTSSAKPLPELQAQGAGRHPRSR